MKYLTLIFLLLLQAIPCTAITKENCDFLYKFYKMNPADGYKQCDEILSNFGKYYNPRILKNDIQMDKILKSDILQCISENKIQNVEATNRKPYVYEHIRLLGHCSSQFTQEELNGMFKGKASQRDKLIEISGKIFKLPLDDNEINFIDELIANKSNLSDEALAKDIDGISLVMKAGKNAQKLIEIDKKFMNLPPEQINISMANEILKAASDLNIIQERLVDLYDRLDRVDYKQLLDNTHNFRMQINPFLSSIPKDISNKFRERLIDISSKLFKSHLDADEKNLLLN